MSTNETSGATDKRGPDESRLADLYRSAAQETPPPGLDADILAQARRAVEAPAPARGALKRWALPVSIAAMVLLSVGIVLQLSERGALGPGESAPSVAYAPAPQVTESRAREAGRDAQAPGTTAAPPSATPRARTERTAPPPPETSGEVASLMLEKRAMLGQGADIVGVTVGGQAGAYEFTATIRSPDKGCKQYADWWEVVSEDGRLLYRRVLLHSHVDEQPFARSGGPIAIAPDAVVWIRAHMNTSGYGGIAFKGSVKQGFAAAPLPADFAAALAQQSPLPDGCAF